jgi:hypothetical protein
MWLCSGNMKERGHLKDHGVDGRRIGSYSGFSRSRKVECGLDLSVSGEGQIAEFYEQGNEPLCSIRCGGDFLTN